VSGYRWNVSNGGNRAVGPAVATAEGRGDRAMVDRLIQACNRYSSLMMLLITVPILTDLDVVLDVWLGQNRPALSYEFVFLLAPVVLVQTMMTGYQLAISATGRLARFSSLTLVCEGISFGAKTLAVTAIGWGPVAVPAIGLGVAALVQVLLVTVVSRELKLHAVLWLRLTIFPITLAMLPALGAALLVREMLAPEWWRFIFVAMASTLVGLPCIWLVAMDRTEREHFIRIARHGVQFARTRRLPGRGSASGAAGIGDRAGE